eukprot:6467521-Amphidinium_carterae.1
MFVWELFMLPCYERWGSSHTRNENEICSLHRCKKNNKHPSFKWNFCGTCLASKYDRLLCEVGIGSERIVGMKASKQGK